MNNIRLELFTLLRDYASLVPARLLQLPACIPFSEINLFLVNCILLNPHFQKYPPSNQYERVFYKTIIARLENALASLDEEEEIDARILDHYLTLLPPSSGPLSGSSGANLRDQICERGQPLGELPSKSFVTHYWKPCSSQESFPTSKRINLVDYQSSTIEESRATVESGTTGLRTWFASRALAKYLIQNPGLVEGKRVLELGSGVGFLGIIVASLQQLAETSDSASPSIWLTDVNEEVLIQCRRNVQLSCNLSSAHESVQFRVLDWEEALRPGVSALQALLQDEINPELVLGADVVFDPTLIPALVALIALMLHPGSNSIAKSAIVALTVRKTETFQLFMDHAQEKGLLLQSITLPQGNDGSDFVDTVELGITTSDVRVLRITLGL